MATKTNTTVNGKDYFRIRRVVGHEIVDGKKVPIYKAFYGRSKTEALKKFDQYKDERLRAKYLREQKLEQEQNRTVGELMEYYDSQVLAYDSNYAPGTRELYRSAYKKHIKGSPLQEIIVKDLTENDVQAYYNGLNVTADALATVNKFMVSFMKWAATAKYCSDVMRAVRIPQKRKVTKSEDIIVWTASEIELIESTMKGHPLCPLIMFSLYGGLRISEALGLKWTDISDNTINVVRQNYRTDIVPPKYGSSRKIPLHQKIAASLEEMDHDCEWIFHTASCNLMDYHNVVRSLERAYKKYGIPNKKFHAYRATFATNLCKKGVRLEVASRLCGHKNVNVTAKYYTSIEQKESADAINLL